MGPSTSSNRATAVLDRYWAWRDRERARVGLAGADGMLWTPARFVFEVVWSMLEGEKIDVAYDPWSTGGLILTSVVESGRAKRGLGACRSPSDRELAVELAGNLPIEWAPVKSPFDSQEALFGLGASGPTPQFDLVVSMPPWNVRDPRAPRDPSGITDTVSHFLLRGSWRCLNPGGLAIAIVPPSFAYRAGGVRDALQGFGLHLDAFIELPPGSFAPSTNVGGAIALIRPGPARDVFGAKLTGDSGHDARALENLRRRVQVPEEPSLGVLVAPEGFRGVGSAIARARLRRHERVTGLRAVPLNDLVRRVQMGRPNVDFQEDPDAVYLPLIGRREAVIRIPDLDLKPQNYVQLTVRPDKVDPQWLAGYLSSPLGLEARETSVSGMFIPRLTRATLGSIPVFLPSRPKQEEASIAHRLAGPIRDELLELGRSIWVDPRAASRLQALARKLDPAESFVGWLDQLPFPLASILWAYQAAGSDSKARYEHLLRFFEALAEFLSLVLLSAAVREEDTQRALFADLRKGFEQGAMTFDRATFGTWRIVVAVLSKGLRKIQGSEGGRDRVAALFKTSDQSVIGMILAKGMSGVLEKVNTYRNEWTGHGGVVGVDEADRRHQLVSAELAEVRTLIGDAWARYHLVLPVVGRFRDGMHQYELRRVIGRASPFEQFEAAVAAPLADGELHLLAPGETEALPLLPLIRLSASPANAENACYFYSKRERGEVRFVSYHFEKQAELRDAFPKVAEALTKLSTAVGPSAASASTK